MTTPKRPGDRVIPPKLPGRRFHLTLTQQILVGLAIGCLLGWLVPSFAVSLKPVSQLFLRLIKMVLAPLLLTTLVAGIAGAGVKVVGRLGLKAILWFELATTVALIIGMVTANLVKPGAGVKLSPDAASESQGKPPATAAQAPGAPPVNQGEKPRATVDAPKAPPEVEFAKPKSFTDFILEIFPISIFDALARNDVLQIVVFSLFLGLALSGAGVKAKPIRELANSGAEMMFKVVGFVMRFAPFGVGAAMAVTLGTNGGTVLLPLVKCILALYAALLVFFGLLFAAMKLLTQVHMPTFLRAIREPALIAFTTASSEAALPRSMEILEQLGIPRRIVGFVVPAGYAFNLDGSTLYLSLALMFVAQAAGVDMTLGEQLAAMLFLMLSTKGVAGVPRAAMVVLAGALTAFHLPAEGVTLLFGIDALMDMGRTCVNVVGNCVATVIVAVWEKEIPSNAPIYGVPVILNVIPPGDTDGERSEFIDEKTVR